MKILVKRVALFSLFLLSLICVSCKKDNVIFHDDKNGGQEELRYYVKYEVPAPKSPVSAALSFTYSFLDDKGNNISGKYSKSGVSQIFGPVKKGFVAEVEATVYNSDFGSSGGQPVNIYVAINEEPFALKASGNGFLSYVIE